MIDPRTQRSAERAIGLTVFALALLSRVAFLNAPSGSRLYNGDEILMAEIVLGRLLGTHPLIPWPAGPLTIVGVPMLGVDWAVQSHLHLSAESFVAFIQGDALVPWRLVSELRFVVAIFFSAGAGALAVALARLTNNVRTALALSLALITLPHLWALSHTATPHAMGFGLACFGVLALVPREGPAGPWRWLLAGLLGALAVTSHVTLSVTVLLLAGLLLDRAEGQRPKAFGLFTLGGLVGTLVGCPYVWLEPVRLAKATTGWPRLAGQSVELLARLVLILGPLGIATVLALLLGFVASAARRRWWLLACGLLATLLTIGPGLHAAALYPRYFLPLALVAVVLPVAACTGLLDAAPRLRERATLALQVALLALVLCVHIPGYWRLRRETIDAPAVAQADAIKRLPDGARVLVPLELIDYLGDRASSASFLRAARGAREALDTLDPRTFPSQAPPAARYLIQHLPSNFQERVQTFETMMALCGDGARPGLELVLWGRDERSRSRLGMMSRSEAIRAYRTREVDYLLVDAPIDDLTARVRFAGGSALYGP